MMQGQKAILFKEASLVSYYLTSVIPSSSVPSQRKLYSTLLFFVQIFLGAANTGDNRLGGLEGLLE